MHRVSLTSSATHVFVEHYPDLVYSQFLDGSLRPGGRQLRFDLLKPVTAQATPLVVFAKGGAFRNVHRARYLPALVPLAQRGIAVASVEYRTSNEALFPAPLEDVQSAIRYFRSHAGDLNIDPRAVAIWGNSAGGTLAALVAGRGQDSVCAGAAWYGLHDLELDATHREPGSVPHSAFGDPDDPATRWIRARDAVAPESAPMFLLHGTDDQVVDVAQSLALQEELERLDIEHELMLVEGGRHSFAEMCTRTDALARTFDFLERHLRHAAADTSRSGAGT